MVRFVTLPVTIARLRDHLAGHRKLAFLEVTSRATARLISSSLRSSVEASVFFAYEIEEAPEALVLHGC